MLLSIFFSKKLLGAMLKESNLTMPIVTIFFVLKFDTLKYCACAVAQTNTNNTKHIFLMKFKL